MRCYLRAAAGRDEPAVAGCPHCGAGFYFALIEHPDLSHAGMHYGRSHTDEVTRLKAARHPETVPGHEHRRLHGVFGHGSKG
jgi:hypothetical protein